MTSLTFDVHEIGQCEGQYEEEDEITLKTSP